MFCGNQSASTKLKMARRRILLLGDETLRKKSKPVEVFDDNLKTLVKDMFETMYKAEGAGLAAVQVGLLKRLFVVNVGGGELVFVNPEILETQGKQKSKVEACLSIPGKWGEVERPNKVRIKYQDENGNFHEETFVGYACKAVCHEYDHLDGILYIDKATKMHDNNEGESN